jgi:putative endonuclease
MRGEIDIVARDGEVIVFVEVKTRDGRDFGAPAEAVTFRKRRRLRATANDFLARHRLTDRPCRFDVVAIQVEGDRPVIEVYKSAFEVGA